MHHTIALNLSDPMSCATLFGLLVIILLAAAVVFDGFEPPSE